MNKEEKEDNEKTLETEEKISLDVEEEDDGGYLFISHSHKDIEKVRQIRNNLEENGFEPLCFFLKCLSDDDEIEDLIKREIDAREWFLYADSPNARKSIWVQKEREYIELTGNKKTISVDLEKNDSMDVISKILVKELTVNIIYSYKDHVFVDFLSKKLKEKELRVTLDTDLSTDNKFKDVDTQNIKKAAQAGVNFIILSNESIHSKAVLNETSIAYENGSNFIPIWLDELTFDGSLEAINLGFMLEPIQSIQLYNIPFSHFDEFLDPIIEDILLNQMKSLNDKLNK